MENITLKKIANFEKVFTAKPSARNTYAMALRYLVGYMITGRGEFLGRANYVLRTASASAINLDLLFLRAQCSRFFEKS
ncbi:MAG: hypothetical protein FWD01_02565, partial [Defluviitaleaceae bacterium]|nr:hypothetical protein [Defluviitaleaceae bacterium]